MCAHFSPEISQAVAVKGLRTLANSMTRLSKLLQGKERDPTVRGLHLSHAPHVLIDLSQLLVVVLQGGQSGVAVGQLAAPLPLLGQQLRLEVQLQLLPQLVPVRLRVLQHLAPPPQRQSSLPSFSLSLFVHLSPAQFTVVYIFIQSQESPCALHPYLRSFPTAAFETVPTGHFFFFFGALY